MLKRCPKCNTDKSLEEFFKNKAKSSGYHSWCKVCMLEYDKVYCNKNKEKRTKLGKEFRKRNPQYKLRWHLKNEYGISLEDYEKMVEQQNSVCAICLKKNYDEHRLFVDHCHNTGKIRGLLCNHCNSAIGLLKEDIELFKSAIKYLENNK